MRRSRGFEGRGGLREAAALGRIAVAFLGSVLAQAASEAQEAAQKALLLVGHSSAQAVPYGPLVAALRLALAHPALGQGVRPIWLAETAKFWLVMQAFPFALSWFALMLLNGVITLDKPGFFPF